MQIYKCPVCGSDIQITDTSLSAHDDFTQSMYSVRIDTTIRHISPILDPACASLFVALAEEQAEIASRVLEKTTQGFLNSQELRGL